MPTSRDGHEYTRHLFKPIPNSMTGGCHADVFLPKLKEGEKAPVAITYHGGGFTICDSQHIFVGHVEYLLKKGFAVVGLEYRMAPHVRFPEIREDLLDGYQWVLDELPKLAPVDPARNFVFGGSAGGYATLSVSIDAHKRGLPLPRANYAAYPLVDLNSRINRDGPTVTYEVALSALSDSDKAKVDALFAEPVSTAHDLQAETPPNLTGRLLWVQLAIASGALNRLLTDASPPYPTEHSPLHNLHASFPPTVTVLAEADTLIDPQSSRDLHARLEELGVESRLLVAEGMPHGALEPTVPGLEQIQGRWWEAVAVPALEFCVDKCRA